MRLILAFLALFIAFPAFADVDDGLYDPVPPEGSAFVRFIKTYAEEAPAAVKAGGKDFGAEGAMEFTPYFVVPQGETDLEIGAGKTKFPIVAGKFYSVVSVAADQAPLVLEDASTDNRTKAMILVYNFDSEAPVSLKTQDGKTEIISAVAKNANGSREINAVKLNTALYANDAAIANPQEIILERGLSYALVFLNGEAKWMQAKTDTRR